jgi:3-polyprenyl-4-hydroxybenzoate decarboxylase
LFNVISIEQLYAGHARDVGLIAAQYGAIGRYTIVVEEDIDPSDMKQVLWALATRSVPEKSIQILNNCHTTSADPTVSLEEKKRYKVAPKPLVSSRAIIDACRPLQWKEDWYPVSRMSPELRAKTFQKWQSVLSGIIERRDPAK